MPYCCTTSLVPARPAATAVEAVAAGHSIDPNLGVLVVGQPYDFSSVGRLGAVADARAAVCPHALHGAVRDRCTCVAHAAAHRCWSRGRLGPCLEQLTAFGGAMRASKGPLRVCSSGSTAPVGRQERRSLKKVDRPAHSRCWFQRLLCFQSCRRFFALLDTR